MSFFDNLKQRKIFQWAAAYLAGAWVFMQLVDVLGSRWGVSDSIARVLDLILIVGFFITLVIAWYHGDQGRQRVSGPELLIIAVLLAVGGLVLPFLNFDNEPPREQNSVAKPVLTDEKPWIAVLPFRVQTADPELDDFAEGLAEDISNGLSDFPYLLVLSRNTTSTLGNDSVDIRQIGKDLGARYILQGALRKAGLTTRITVQLVDAQNGTQIWVETFDREITGSGVLAIQDELTDQIVATVADPAGIVVRTLAAPADLKAPEDLTPYEAVLRYFLFQQRISEADHLITRTGLEQAVELDPGYADAWTSLSLIYQQEFMNNLNPLPDPLQRGLAAAQRAVDLDPTSSRAHFAMAQVHYFMRDVSTFLVHARRAIELNPRNTDTMAMVGIMMGYSGDWESGVGLTIQAMSLNPHHAGWYYFSSFFSEYNQRNYSEALEIARKINLPEYWAYWVAIVISNAQLGNDAAAKNAAQELRRVWPNVERDYYQIGMVNWAYSQPEFIEHTNEGLRKAGINLQVPGPVKN